MRHPSSASVKNIEALADDAEDYLFMNEVRESASRIEPVSGLRRSGGP